jgi:ferredoxin-type protein NapH
MSALKTARQTCQLAVAVGVPLLAWANSNNWVHVSGNFLSFSLFGYPLADPLAALQVGFSSLDWPWRMVAGGATALALALVLGTVFCSWACPFGLLSELAAPRGPAPMGRPGWRRKVLLAGAVLAAIALLGLPPLLNQVSLPGWYSRLFQAWFNQQDLALPGILLVLGALAVERAAGRRLWCRYVCPQSLLLNFIHRFSPLGLRVRFDPARCTCAKGHEQCARACTLGLNPRLAGRGLEWECSTCGDCTTACAACGRSLTLGLGPGKRT